MRAGPTPETQCSPLESELEQGLWVAAPFQSDPVIKSLALEPDGLGSCHDTVLCEVGVTSFLYALFSLPVKWVSNPHIYLARLTERLNELIEVKFFK